MLLRRSPSVASAGNSSVVLPLLARTEMVKPGMIDLSPGRAPAPLEPIRLHNRELQFRTKERMSYKKIPICAIPKS